MLSLLYTEQTNRGHRPLPPDGFWLAQSYILCLVFQPLLWGEVATTGEEQINPNGLMCDLIENKEIGN